MFSQVGTRALHLAGAVTRGPARHLSSSHPGLTAPGVRPVSFDGLLFLFRIIGRNRDMTVVCRLFCSRVYLSFSVRFPDGEINEYFLDGLTFGFCKVWTGIHSVHRTLVFNCTLMTDIMVIGRYFNELFPFTLWTIVQFVVMSAFLYFHERIGRSELMDQSVEAPATGLMYSAERLGTFLIILFISSPHRLRRITKKFSAFKHQQQTFWCYFRLFLQSCIFCTV